MEEQMVKSRITQRQYKLSEMQRITNARQIALYIKNGITLYDLHCSQLIDPVSQEERPMLVAYFKKSETKWAYDLWRRGELK